MIRRSRPDEPRIVDWRAGVVSIDRRFGQAIHARSIRGVRPRLKLESLSRSDGCDEVSQREVLAWVTLDVKAGERLRRASEVLDANILRVCVAAKSDYRYVTSSRRCAIWS